MKHTGRLILLIAMDMCDRIHGQFEQMGAKVDVIGVIPRGCFDPKGRILAVCEERLRLFAPPSVQPIVDLSLEALFPIQRV